MVVPSEARQQTPHCCETQLIKVVEGMMVREELEVKYEELALVQVHVKGQVQVQTQMQVQEHLEE